MICISHKQWRKLNKIEQNLNKENPYNLFSFRRGRDRCRHFVINQNKEGQFIVTGDTEMHDSLTSLIEYYKTSPIEPFGEYLTVSCFEVQWLTFKCFNLAEFILKQS